EKTNYTKIPIHFQNLRLGIDFFPNDKTVFGVQFTPNMSAHSPYNRNSSKVFDENYINTFDFQTRTDNKNKNINGVANVNFKRTLSKPGSEITADFDFGTFSNNGNSVNITRYFDTQGGMLRSDYQLDGDQEGLLHFYIVKADFTHSFGNEFKMETGFKLSFVDSDQDAAFFEKTESGYIPDLNKTNHFIYRENTNAAYVTFSRQFDKWDFQAGLRGENTRYSTRQIVGEITFDSSYFQLFPTF